MSLSLAAALTIAAIFLGPIVAVQLTRYLDDRKQAQQRKLHVFKILMATRSTALSPAHVEALNQIDLEFSSKNQKEKDVINAWKAYLDHLCSPIMGDHWFSRRTDLLVELLHTMATVLKFEFDKTHIKNAAYFPRGHSEIEDDQSAIRRGVRVLLESKRGIPMYVTNFPAQQPPGQVHEDAGQGE